MRFRSILWMRRGVNSYQGRFVNHAVQISDGWVELVGGADLLCPSMTLRTVAVLEMVDPWAIGNIQLTAEILELVEQRLNVVTKPSFVTGSHETSRFFQQRAADVLRLQFLAGHGRSLLAS